MDDRDQVSSQLRWPYGNFARRRRERAPGFTLIELLVALALLGVLATLLLPTLAKAKASAYSARCKSNLRQIDLAMLMYLGDFQYYPQLASVQAIGPRGAMLVVSSLWDDEPYPGLAPYLTVNAPGLLQTPPLFICPAKKASNSLPGRRIDYGYNVTGGAWDGDSRVMLGLAPVQSGAPENFGQIQFVSEASVLCPSDMIALGDNSATPVDFNDWIDPFNEYFQPNPLHNGGDNVTFCDGHVEFAKQTRWITPSETANRRWNRDHQPHLKPLGNPTMSAP